MRTFGLYIVFLLTTVNRYMIYIILFAWHHISFADRLTLYKENGKFYKVME